MTLMIPVGLGTANATRRMPHSGAQKEGLIITSLDNEAILAGRCIGDEQHKWFRPGRRAPSGRGARWITRADEIARAAASHQTDSDRDRSGRSS
jgi:hypothetical protein